MIQIVGLTLAFAVILFLSVKRVNVVLSILAGATVLTVASGISVRSFATASIEAILDFQTINLALQVATIGMLAYCMKEAQLVNDLIAGLKTLLPTRILIAVIPAIIGLLQMPGGALLSAPLIDKEAGDLGLTPERKVAVNITFRHIWFYVYPLAPSLVLAAGLAHINLYQLAMIQTPSFLLSVTVGYFLLIRRLRKSKIHSKNSSYGSVLKGLSPILITVLFNMLGLPLVISVLLGLVSCLMIKRSAAKQAMRLLVSKYSWTPMLSVISVMILRQIIQESEVIPALQQLLKSTQVPFMSFATVLPFVIGAVSGLPIAGIGISIPLVVSLFGGARPPMISMVVLSTYAGYYVSLLHLCLVLSNQYYQAKIQEVYRLWIPHMLTVCGAGIALDMLLLVF